MSGYEEMFKAVVRECPECGRDWDSLQIWPEDMPCHDCSRQSHAAMVAGLNEGRPYVIESIGGMCPTQAEGTWVDGQRFYFRARHGTYTLQVDPDDAVGGEWIAGGDDPTHGSMSPEEVVAVLDKAAGHKP